MTVYIDTSVLVAYYCPEPLSRRVEEFITVQIKPAISALTEVELFSALSRNVREGGLDRKDASRIASKFISHVDNFMYTVMSLEDHHYRLARDWIGLFKLPLKSLDALHLAIASSESLTIVTADRNLSHSAKALGIEAILFE